MQRNTMVATSRAYGLDTQYLALPNYVRVGTSSGGGRLFIAHPDEDLRFDQTFPLANLIAQAELTRIWQLPNRFPAWVGVIGYTVQSAGLSLILQPAPLTLLMAVALVSGASRLVAGLMRMAQVAGISDSHLSVAVQSGLLVWRARRP
jgi:hypothetical protein